MVLRKKKKDASAEIEKAIDQNTLVKNSKRKRKKILPVAESIDHEVAKEEIKQDLNQDEPIAETMEEKLLTVKLPQQVVIPYVDEKTTAEAYPELKTDHPKYESKKEVEKADAGAVIPLPDPVTEAKAKIQDWYYGLPRKNSPDREKKKKLI